jgi:hypothetical protein
MNPDTLSSERPMPGTTSQMPDVDPAVASEVARWMTRIRAAKNKWSKDFERMRENMKFAAGRQYTNQQSMDSGERYMVNLVNRVINQKVASLYAKNPTATWERRPRMDFQIWDEKIESLLPLVQKTAMGVPLDITESALVADYMHGMQMRLMLDKVGETLEKLYQYSIDEHDPNFKTQLKGLVRRTCTTGVGYIRVGFERDDKAILRSSGMGNDLLDRAKRLQTMIQQVELDGADETDGRIERLRVLAESLSLALNGEETEVTPTERLVFDFLPSTSVIPDTQCKSLRGFVGARWIAIEKELPLDDVAAFFEKRDLPSQLSRSDPSKRLADRTSAQSDGEDPEPMAVVYEVFDKVTKQYFFLCDGYTDYLQPPAPCDAEIGGFWPVFALTFNDVETEGGDGVDAVSIYPPSDVELIRHAQKEWNRTRNELSHHRMANAPRYVTQKGWLEPEDKEKLINAAPNEVIEITGIPPNGDFTKALIAFQPAQIDPNLYNTDPLFQDIMLSVGAQEANLGPANPQTTATGQTIAEQSRTLGLSSNVDDLDDLLCAVARAAGDISLQSFSIEHVKRVVGAGAVWPDEPELRKDFLNEVYLVIEAASSGRPNKAVEIANWERVAPTLAQAGANPMFLIRETIKRVDDRLDPVDAFPVPGMQPGMAAAPAPQGGVAGQVTAQGRPGPGKLGPRQPLQSVPSGQSVPLVGQT